jgi:hypothetical protein
MHERSDHALAVCIAGRRHLLPAQPSGQGCEWRDAARRSVDIGVFKAQLLIAVGTRRGAAISSPVAKVLACYAAGVCSGGNSSVPFIASQACVQLEGQAVRYQLCTYTHLSGEVGEFVCSRAVRRWGSGLRACPCQVRQLRNRSSSSSSSGGAGGDSSGAGGGSCSRGSGYHCTADGATKAKEAGGSSR